MYKMLHIYIYSFQECSLLSIYTIYMHIHTYKHTRPCACIKKKVDVFVHFTLFISSDPWNLLNCWIQKTRFQSSTAVTLLYSCICVIVTLKSHTTVSISHCGQQLVVHTHLTSSWISSEHLPLFCLSFSFAFENFLFTNLINLFSSVEQ